MIRKTDLKEKAIALRKKGLTYSEILKLVAVAKSTLSIWLQEVGLSIPQKQKITQKRIEGRLRALTVIRANKIKRVSGIKEVALLEVPLLINDPLWLSGVMLYWAEGSKEHGYASSVQITNMDVQVHKIFVAWSKKFFQVGDDRFVYSIYIHEKADIEAARVYWSSMLNVKREVFRLYYKKHNPNPKRSHIGKDYYGILKISLLNSISPNRKIAGWIDGVVVYLGGQA